MQIFEVNGARLAIPEDDWMLQDIVHRGEYEPYVIASFMGLISPQSNVLDIGANVGVFTVLAAKRAKSVLAIEASPENAKIVAANVALNGLKNVTVYPVAVSDKLEMATFSKVPFTNKLMRPKRLTPDTLDQIDVTMAVPLDFLLGHTRFDVVKIDVEGREFAALAGAKKLWDMRPSFVTEFSPEFIQDGSGVDGRTYLNLFFSKSYDAVILHRDMTQEQAGQDSDLLYTRWQEYKNRNITHLDLLMVPRKLPWLRHWTRLRHGRQTVA